MLFLYLLYLQSTNRQMRPWVQSSLKASALLFSTMAAQIASLQSLMQWRKSLPSLQGEFFFFSTPVDMGRSSIRTMPHQTSRMNLRLWQEVFIKKPRVMHIFVSGYSIVPNIAGSDSDIFLCRCIHVVFSKVRSIEKSEKCRKCNMLLLSYVLYTRLFNLFSLSLHF